MKRFLFLMCALLFMGTSVVLAQTAEPEAPVYENIFLTFPALTAAVVFIIEAIKKFAPSMSGLVTQIVSWLIGIVICFFGWFFGLGFLDGLPWFIVLAYGIGISLASNGIADTGLIQWIISLFARKKDTGVGVRM